MSETATTRENHVVTSIARALALLLCGSILLATQSTAQVTKSKRSTRPTTTTKPALRPLPLKEARPWTVLERVSARWDLVAGDGAAQEAAISSDGRFIAFASEADNLVEGDSPGKADIFVFDRSTGDIELISKGHDGSPTDGQSRRPAISADGRYVVFNSTAKNLVPGNIGGNDVFVYDRSSDQTRWISYELDSSDSGTRIDTPNPAGHPSISADGHTIVFERTMNNLPGNPSHIMVYRYDPVSGDESIEPVDLVPGSNDLSNGSAFRPAISADARFVAYQSRATDLVAQDTNGYDDIFLYDRTTNSTTRISRAWTSSGCGDLAGADANFASYGAALSADGRYIAFRNNASNLVASDTNGGTADIFVFDRTTCTTELVSRASRNSDGSPGDQGDSWSLDKPAISANGQFVAFTSNATNMVDNDTNGVDDTFVTDWLAGETVRVSVANNLADGEANGASKMPVLSGDGQLVVFLSDATNLVTDDANGLKDVFVRDRYAGTTVCVGTACAMTVANDSSGGGYISADGRFATFRSSATNLVAGVNPFGNVYVRDRKTGKVELISVATNGTPANSMSFGGSMSDDGRFVVFSSHATNLAPVAEAGSTGAAKYSDIYLRDRKARTTVRISESPGGHGGDGHSHIPRISADGKMVVFRSGASNLGPPSGGEWNIFIYDRSSNSMSSIDQTIDGQLPNGPSYSPAVSADGRFVAFMSRASNLDPADPTTDWDVFVYDRVADKVEWISRNIAGSLRTDGGRPAISGDGRFVAYQAIPYYGDGSVHLQRINVFDRSTDQIVASYAGQPPLVANGFFPAISRDGNLVVVHAWNDDYVPDALWGQGAQIFVRSANTWALIAESAYATEFAKSGNLVIFGSRHEGLVDDGAETYYPDTFVAGRSPSLDPYYGARCGQ